MSEERLTAGIAKRERWVDDVKTTACILVVLGHFFQSMTKAGILPANSLYHWFNQTIYYFHVPLFFICSGYLYQELSRVDDAHKVDNLHSWGRNMAKKALNLGVPYFTFSFATWLLKTVFSSSTNNQIGGLADVLFLHPTSPYWFLYALFFIFLVTPTFQNKTMSGVGLTVAVVIKFLGISGGYRIQAMSYVFAHEIWFIIGMGISVWGIKEKVQKVDIIIPIVTGMSFVCLSVLLCRKGLENGYISFLMGLIGCSSVLMLMVILNYKQVALLEYLAKYTMPIFLMHTLFAAPLRILLLKIGIRSAAVHVMLGIMISFFGPIVAAIVTKKSKWLEFFLYPGKYMKIDAGYGRNQSGERNSDDKG